MVIRASLDQADGKLFLVQITSMRCCQKHSCIFCLPMLPFHHTLAPTIGTCPQNLLNPEGVYENHWFRLTLNQCKNSLYRLPEKCLPRIVKLLCAISQRSLFCHWEDLIVRKYFPIPSSDLPPSYLLVLVQVLPFEVAWHKSVLSLFFRLIKY